MDLRGHKPVSTTEFKGLFRRGNPEDTPEGYFQDCNNLKFIGRGGIQTRDGIGISQDVVAPLQNIKRIYNYPTLNLQTLIVLTIDDNTGEGNIYHIVDEDTVYGPILTIDGMEDFAFLPYAGRGYISPFASQFPTLSKPSAAPVLALANGTDIESGLHQYAFTFVTAIGETTPSPLGEVTTDTVGLSTPTSFLNIDNLGGGGINHLTAGQSYSWKITYTLQNTALETDVGPISNVLVAVAGVQYGYQLSALVPAEAIYVNIYRTLGNGAVYFREIQLLRGTVNNTFPIGGSVRGTIGLVTDAVLATRPNPPGVNSSTSGIVNVSGVLIGDSSVLSRKIYRTAANASQLKLLTTLADNVTTTYVDNNADASLGANVPTTNSATVDGPRVEKGLENEVLYVYAGDGTAARPAAGDPLSGTLVIANGLAGHTDAGVHVFGFVYETISGFLSAPFSLQAFTTSASQSVSFGSVPASSDPNIVARHLVASVVIPTYDGNVTGHQLFFVPNATIPNGTDTFLNNISFYDADLLDDADYLIDNFAEIPAGAVLGLYHNRLVLATTFEQISIAYLSTPGEPEAIDQVDGLLAFPPDGNPITNVQELRDVIYLFKKSKTGAYVDNDDVPSTWGPFSLIDAALGTSVHGVAVVIDSGSNNVDFLMICTFQGVTLFNGRYIQPELSWNIEDYWRAFDKNEFRRIQVLLDPIRKWILVVTPDRNILYADYSNGLDPKNIRWCPWSFLMGVNTIAIWNTDEIIFGSDLQ